MWAPLCELKTVCSILDILVWKIASNMYVSYPRCVTNDLPKNSHRSTFIPSPSKESGTIVWIQTNQKYCWAPMHSLFGRDPRWHTHNFSLPSRSSLSDSSPLAHPLAFAPFLSLLPPFSLLSLLSHSLSCLTAKDVNQHSTRDVASLQPRIH